MLKKMLLALLALLMMCAACASAETPDLTQMTFEELAELRAQVNAEILTRPEATPIILGNGGKYIVGKDLKPGTYSFIYAGGSSGSAKVYVYQDETESKVLQDFFVTSNKYAVFTLHDLKDGNCIVPGFTIKLSAAGFPEYTPPEGVLIPAGIYEIGTDIPAGKYSFHMNESGCYIEVYKDMETYENRVNSYSSEYLYRMYLDALNLSTTGPLKEGNILVINNASIIMKKFVPTFNFD